ncbi:IS3 family transposase [Roseateles sp. P5_E8]
MASTQLKAEFAASGRVYGSRRLCAVLRAKGLRLGRHRVRRLMREHRLRALWRRKFIHTTDSGHALPVCDNVLARRFDPVREEFWMRGGCLEQHTNEPIPRPTARRFPDKSPSTQHWGFLGRGGDRRDRWRRRRRPSHSKTVRNITALVAGPPNETALSSDVKRSRPTLSPRISV